MTKRRKYSPEFKREAFLLTQQSGVNCRQIALDIGVNPNRLNCWKREAEQSKEQAFKGYGSPRDEEMPKLKRELAKVKKERDFFAKRQPSSPKSYRKVSGDIALSRKLCSSNDVPLPECFTERLLRVGGASAKCA